MLAYDSLCINSNINYSNYCTMSKIRIPLEAILPESLKKSIYEYVELFRKGVSLTQNKVYTHTVEIGFLELDDIIIYVDNTMFEIICQEVSSYFDVSLTELFTPSMERFYCEKRQLIQTFALKYTKLTSQEIARRTNRKTHAAVLNAQKVVNNLVATEASFARDYNEIEKKIKFHIIND